jgi:PIN domain nuclease of toxin-antitoxin system
MKCLLDTHLLLWAALTPDRLSPPARVLIEDPQNDLFFSAASIWEVAIKHGLGRADFTLDAQLLRRGLLDNGYAELAITGQHAAAIASLPPIHKDPFDRLLVAQAAAEGFLLLTADDAVAQYPGPVRRV